jgi:hypothetical protein
MRLLCTMSTLPLNSQSPEKYSKIVLLAPITLARFGKIGMKHRHRGAASQRETQNDNGDDLFHDPLLNRPVSHICTIHAQPL